MDADPVTDESSLPVPPPPVVAGCVPAWIAAMVAATTDVLYIVIIAKQGPPYAVAWVGTVFLIVAALATCAAVAGSTSRGLGMRKVCALIAAGGLVVLGFLALFSIGLPLMVAGGCAAAASVKLNGASRTPAG